MSMLEARNILFEYDPGNPVLSEVSFTVESNERVALKAPSGRGKTTLCQILAGYLQPKSGEVLLDGSPLPTKGVSPVQMIWQHPELAVDPRMKMQAVLDEAGSVEQRLLDLLGIKKQWLSRYPHELSGGELQRFCIARALATEPSFLIADEISTMLDALTQAQIWQALLHECAEQNIGLIAVTHSPALAARITERTIDL